ncbi:MAG: tetratricopeptide repeat protein [Flavobacteriales bacterium]|nr:tetratricopeptide repeat protein [Flavobacteriales bacterium]
MRRALLVVSIALLGFGCDTSTKEANQESVEEVSAVLPGEAKLDSLTKLIEANPNDPKLLNERSKVFLEVNETNYALADVGRALMMDSTIADFYLTISDVYFRLNKPQLCLSALQKAHALQPDMLEPLYRLAQFSLYIDKFQECINYANDMLRINARDDRPFMVKSLCYSELGDTTKAIENMLEAVTLNPDNFDGYMQLGVLHYHKKDPRAEDYFRAALDIRPDDILTLYDLGLFYQDNDRLNDALRTYTHILELDSTYTNAYYNMGYIHYQYLKEYDKALENFDKAVKLNPKYHQAVYMRGLCYEAKGDVQRAKSEYSYAIQLNPDYKLAADGLTRLLSKTPK